MNFMALLFEIGSFYCRQDTGVSFLCDSTMKIFLYNFVKVVDLK